MAFSRPAPHKSAMSVRIATFNVENLLARFDFSGWRRDHRRDPALSLVDVRNEKHYRQLEQARVVAHADDARQMTALALADCRADILCLQEVENLETLEAFERSYLYRMTGLSYPHKVWKQGNDGRGIDVALMAREKTRDGRPIELINAKTHRKVTFADLGLHSKLLGERGHERDDRVFRRDCLEVDLAIGGKRLTLYVVHLKSMGPSRDGMEGRLYTMPIRSAEAMAVRRLIERRFGSERTPKMRWLVCGDMNDYRERLVVGGDRFDGFNFSTKVENVSGLDPLMNDGFSVNLVDRRPADDRWTLFHASGPAGEGASMQERRRQHLVQLDYLLASPALAKGNIDAVPDIIRFGQPFRTPFPPGQDVERYPRTGWDRPKASDHCPVAVTLEMV